MNRRRFLKQGMVAGTAVLGLAGTGCTRDLRGSLVRPGPEPSGRLEETAARILFYASLAPSGHNSQPWFVRVAGPGEWIVGADPERRLPVVDPDNREVLLSIGAFLENLVRAARVFGHETEIEILAQGRFDREVLRVRLAPAAVAESDCLRRIAARRTIKSGLGSGLLEPTDLRVLEAAAGGNLHYFPRGSSHARAMAEAAVENFRIQFSSGAAMAEAAEWTRLSDREAVRFRDGLTPDGMEIAGFSGFWVRHFMESRDVAGHLWREKAVEKVEAQAREGAGWLVITSPSDGVADLIASGQRFQRLALAAVPMGLGIHPMTQTLEERRGQETIRANHSASMIPQFMLRIGYADPYPQPVSLRRPVNWFLVG
jgi:nitroreductase